MIIDFKENIELLEKLVFNFILTEDDNDIVIKPKNYEELDKREIIPMIKAHYFNNDTIQRVYREAKKFFLEYQKIPTRNELHTITNLAYFDLDRDDVDNLFDIDLKKYTYDFLYKYTKAFVFYKNLNEVAIDTMSFLKTSEITPDNVEIITNDIREKFNDRLSLSLSSADSGLDFFNVLDHVQLSKSGTPTGFKFFDKVLDGGWNLKTLVIFQGRPKVGKSMVLSNIAARAFLCGNNVGIATLELADRKYMKRLGAQILKISTSEYDTFVTTEGVAGVADKINQLKKDIPNIGNLSIKEFGAGTASAIDIENHFLKVQQRTGVKFKIIIVDYVNLMRALKDRGDTYGTIKSITEELRAIAMRNEWCIISATQIKRDAVDDMDLSMSDVAESFGLVHTVDSLFGLTRGPLERRMKIKLIANRDGGYTESFKMYRLNYEFANMVEELDPASEYYSDDNDATQTLEDQMRNQYQIIQQPQFSQNLIDIPKDPPMLTPNTGYSSYDDILDSIK